MLHFLQVAVGWLTPVFVVSSMLNVGLTQHPLKIVAHLRNWRFLVRMLIVSFLVVPALMILAADVLHVEEVYRIGLVLFACAAGAPLLIKLTVQSHNTVALGATVQLVLMVATIVFLPFLLPLFLGDVTVDSWAMTKSLVEQMVLPMAVGMLLLCFARKVTAVVQPWVARISSIALYAMLAASVIGHAPAMVDPGLWVAIAAGVVALLLSFFLGYGNGQGRRELSEIGALGTAQRNTAAAMIVAQGNFEDPRVFIVVALLNTFMMFILMVHAALFAKDVDMVLFEPLMADEPTVPTGTGAPAGPAK